MPLSFSPGDSDDRREGRFTDYYYGVSKGESTRSGLRRYEADAGFNPYLGLSASYSLTEQWGLTGSTRLTFLSSEIQDSPMVDKSPLFGVTLGVSYTF